MRPPPTSVRLVTVQFQSTHPGWGATPSAGDYSILAASFNPRTPGGVRHNSHPRRWRRLCFNPRTPGGVRLSCRTSCNKSEKFQSTHPGWGATKKIVHIFAAFKFQSTHPGWGATCSIHVRAKWENGFNPRTPGGVRPNSVAKISLLICFNPRTPGGVRPDGSTNNINLKKSFNPRTPGGVRLCYITTL